MIFTGTYKHSIDLKNRLTFPAKIAEKLGNEIYISKGFDGCLEIRTIEQFKTYTNKVLEYSETSKDSRSLQRVFLSSSFKLTIDGAKRILLPSNLLEKTQIKNEVYIIGVGNKLELWEPSQFDSYSKSAEEKYEVIAEQIYDKTK